jgi:membrane fusion protein, multidrug efflux system
MAVSFLKDWRVRLVAALLLAVAALASWRLGYLPWTGGDAERSASSFRRHHGDEEQGPVPVTVAPARSQDVPVTIDAVGTVQALNTATIHTQVDGRLINQPFNEGEDVKRGDVVALIEPNLYQAAYDQAVAKKSQDEATLANARIDLVRYQKLAVSNYGSQQQYTTQKFLVAQLEAQVRADQAAIDSAKTTLDYCTIHSPIDGRTGIRLVDVGNILHASDQAGILVVTQLKPIYVFFTIPQQSLPAVQRAQEKGAPKVSALAPDNATVIEGGELAVIDNQIDPATGTAKLKAVFANGALRLWPGEFVNVRAVVDVLENVVTVPSPAIQRGPSGAFVYTLGEDGSAVLTNVTTGQQDENTAVVTQGLKPGAQVITTGFSRLSNGAKVRVVPAQDGGAKSETQAPDGAISTVGDRERRRGGESAPTKRE